MYLFGISDQAGGFDPLILLLLAMMIEAYVGRLSFLARFAGHPTMIIINSIRWFDRKLNRDSRSQMDRAGRGAIAVLIVIGVCLVIGWSIAWLSQNFPFAWGFETLLLIMLINQRSIFTPILKMGRALRDEGLEPARRILGDLTHEAPDKMDEHGIARKGIETLAAAYSERAVAPIFWYILFGFPGLLIYTAVSLMAAEIGHATPQYKAFGFTAARLNGVLLLAPAWLGGLLLAVASLFTPSANPSKSIGTMFRDGGKYHSNNRGWTIGAMAGALGLALGGPRKFSQATINESWIGKGSARASHLDIRRALYLFAVACLINGAWVGGLTVIRIL